MKLNKDGTPRKKDRVAKGTSFVTYTLKQLIDQLPEGTKVVASRKGQRLSARRWRTSLCHTIKTATQKETGATSNLMNPNQNSKQKNQLKKPSP